MLILTIPTSDRRRIATSRIPVECFLLLESSCWDEMRKDDVVHVRGGEKRKKNDKLESKQDCKLSLQCLV